jgi:hypothetical protein
MSRYTTAQNSRYCSSINLRQTSKVPLHDLKIGVWCAIISTQIVRPISFQQPINSECVSTIFFSPFFDSITEEKTWLFYAR